MSNASSIKSISAAEALLRVRRPRLPGHGLDDTGRYLDIGEDRVALDDVIAYRAAGLESKDFASTFATAGVFGAGAVIFLTIVFSYHWRDRFLIGAALLGLIALFALIDVKRVRWHRTYTFDLELRDGSRRRFVTADEAGAARIKDALECAQSARTT